MAGKREGREGSREGRKRREWRERTEGTGRESTGGSRGGQEKCNMHKESLNIEHTFNTRRIHMEYT